MQTKKDKTKMTIKGKKRYAFMHYCEFCGMAGWVKRIYWLTKKSGTEMYELCDVCLGNGWYPVHRYSDEVDNRS